MQYACIDLTHSFSAKAVLEVNALPRLVSFAQLNQIQSVETQAIHHVTFDPSVPFLEVTKLWQRCLGQLQMKLHHRSRLYRAERYHGDKARMSTFYRGGYHEHRSARFDHFRLFKAFREIAEQYLADLWMEGYCH